MAASYCSDIPRSACYREKYVQKDVEFDFVDFFDLLLNHRVLLKTCVKIDRKEKAYLILEINFVVS